MLLELNFRTKWQPSQTCNHCLWLRLSGSSSFHSPSCGSWGLKEWQRPSHTGRTCTSYGRRAPPGCGRWACPSSWRWRRIGRTWMSSHLWQGWRNICKSHFQLSIVGPLNTQSSRTARGEPISPGRLCGQRNTKRGISLHQTTPNNVFRKVWFWVFFFSEQKLSFIVHL